MKNRMMLAQEVADEFRAKAVEMGVEGEAVIHAFMSGCNGRGDPDSAGAIGCVAAGVVERERIQWRLCHRPHTDADCGL